MNLRIRCALTALAVLDGNVAGAGAHHHHKAEEAEPENEPQRQRYVVKFKKKRGIIRMHHSLRVHNRTTTTAISDQKAAVMDLDPAGAEMWERRDDVDYVERDEKVYMSAERVPYGIRKVHALGVDDGPVSNRMVCIVDSGYDVGHPDLPKSEDVVTGSEDRGAGPWDQDDDGHGTHVAGTIAALGGNGIGVAGVSRGGRLRLHVVRVFDAEGWAWASDMVSAVDECVRAGSNVVSVSAGRPGPYLRFEADAYRSFFEDSGVLLVAAAGNAGNDEHSWPASYDSVISVGAVDSRKELGTFSQRTDQVELVAPGVGVRSTAPGGLYAKKTGTSMATPHVAGVAALVWSHFPTRSAAEVREALAATAEDLGPEGRDNSFGFGLVQAVSAYEYLSGKSVGCDNRYRRCGRWARNGECKDNAIFMHAQCRKSCGLCEVRS